MICPILPEATTVKDMYKLARIHLAAVVVVVFVLVSVIIITGTARLTTTPFSELSTNWGYFGG